MSANPDLAVLLKGAVLSPDGLYRYRLTRRWGPTQRAATFVMLNPSTADATHDDPTIRRCAGFARSWRLDGLVVVNLYALRATDPRALRGAADPVGPANDGHILDAMMDAERDGTPVVAAWGAHGRPDRVREVALAAEACRVSLMALGVTKGGQPRHPLYLRGDSPLTPYEAAS